MNALFKVSNAIGEYFSHKQLRSLPEPITDSGGT